MENSQQNRGSVVSTLPAAPSMWPGSLSTRHKRRRRHQKGIASSTFVTVPININVIISIYLSRLDNFLIIPSKFITYKNLRQDFFKFFGLNFEFMNENHKKSLLTSLKLELSKKYNIPESINIKEFRFPISFPIKTKQDSVKKIPTLKELIIYKINENDNIVNFIIRPVLEYLGVNSYDEKVQPSEILKPIFKDSFNNTITLSNDISNKDRMESIFTFANSLKNRSVAICNNRQLQRRRQQGKKWWTAMVSDFGSPDR